MKKIILKVIALVVLITSSVVSATPYTYETRSLVAIEGSYNSYDVENDATPAVRKKVDFGGVGLKIGAQTETVRVFLSARDNFIDGYDYAYSYGGEVQYLFNFASFANFFVGANGGYTNMRFVDSSNNSAKVDSMYFGGDAGFNIHLGDGIDFEVGGRMMKLSDATTTTSTPLTYTLDNIITGYASIIFKYSMDKY